MSSTANITTNDLITYVNRSIALAIPHDLKEVTNTHVKSTVSLTIVNKDNLHNAATLLVAVKRTLNEIDDAKKTAFKPIKDAIKAAEKTIKPYDDQLTSAETVLKDAIAKYHVEVDDKATITSDRIQRRLEKGTMKIQTGMVKLGDIEQADTKLDVDGGWVQIRDGQPKVSIVNLAAIPVDYVMRATVLETIRKEIAADIKKGIPCPKGAIMTKSKTVAVGVTDE